VSHIPLLIGVILLVGAAVIIWRRPSENSPLTVMFLTGVALIFLSDERIQNLKFGTSGVEVSREKFHEAQEDVGVQIGSLRAEIERQKQILDQHQRLLDTKRPAAADAPGPAAPVATEVREIEKKFSENSQYLILVFFRPGQRNAAEALTANLLKRGYRSSSIPTDLTEVSIPGIETKSGTVVIARARQVPASLAKEISTAAAQIASTYNLSPPVVNNDEWPFRRGHIQVYMY
jgi:hypothetical protein